MRVKVEIIREEGVEGDVSIETHNKRGEAFNVMKAVQVEIGKTETFLVPPDGRLVINTPRAIEKPVYDRDQAAAFYPSSQRNSDTEVDRPIPAEMIAVKEKELEELKRQENDRKNREQAEAAERAKAAAASQQANTGSQTATTPTTTRTPPQGGQPLNKTPETGMTATPGGTVKTTTQPSTTPAHGGAPQGGNTEKK